MIFQFLLLLHLIQACVAINNGLALTPPMGVSTWCIESLFCTMDWCNEKEMRSVGLAMNQSGMVALGYNYMLLDDCWSATKRASNGAIEADTSRFPSGTLKPLADYLHGVGVKLGAYTDVGAKTCRGGRTGSGGHYIQDANTFASWNLDFVKADYCHRPANESAQQMYGQLERALNQTGRPMLFNQCSWGRESDGAYPWQFGYKVANTWRVNADHLPLWWTPVTKQTPGDGQGTSNIIQRFAGLSQYPHGPGVGWSDADFLMTGLLETEEMEKTEFAFWCLFSTPLIVATDIRNMRNKHVLLNKELIDVNQDALGSMGDLRVNSTSGAQLWSKALSRGRFAVILYNRNLIFGDISIGIDFNRTTHPNWPVGSTSAKVRDLWSHVDLGTFKDAFPPQALSPRHSLTFLVTPQ